MQYLFRKKKMETGGVGLVGYMDMRWDPNSAASHGVTSLMMLFRMTRTAKRNSMNGALNLAARSHASITMPPTPPSSRRDIPPV